MIALSVVLVFWSFRLRYPQWLRRPLRALYWPFRPFITFQEARILQYEVPMSINDETPASVANRSLRRSDIFLALIGLLMINGWMAAGAYQLHYSPDEPAVALAYPFVIACSWIFPFARPLARPIITVPFDLLAANVLYTLCSLTNAIIAVERKIVLDIPFVWWPLLVVQLFQLGAAAIATLFIFTCPINDILDSSSTSPEDSMTLWSFLTYSWVYALYKVCICARGSILLFKALKCCIGRVSII